MSTLKTITSVLLINIAFFSTLLANNYDVSCGLNGGVCIASKDITQDETIQYGTDYTFSIDVVQQHIINSFYMTKCTFEIFTKSGKNYIMESYPLLGGFPYTISMNIPSVSSIPDGYDWVKLFNLLKAGIRCEGVLLDDLAFLWKIDFCVYIPYKPSTPTMIIQSIEENRVTLRFASHGVESFYLTHETEDPNFMIPFRIANNPDFNNINYCTIPDVDLGIKNFFTIIAENQYGNSAPTVVTCGGTVQISSPLNNNIPVMNVYVSGNNLSLMFETAPGISVEQSIKKVEIINLTGSVIKTIFPNRSKTNIDITSLSDGLYFVKVADETGKIYSDKFFK